MNQEKILRSIILYSKELTDIALRTRPDADRESVEVTASVMLLIASIYLINTLSPGVAGNALIDSLVDRLPRLMEDRKVSISQAVIEKDLIPEITSELFGAYHTNLLGAFTAIYNVRVANDIQRITSYEEGPGGAFMGAALVIDEAITNSGETTNMAAITNILAKHMSNFEATTGTGSKACFVATACFGSSNAHAVIVLRKYRESILKRKPLGRFFVRSYYLFSPPIAKFIERHDKLKKYIGKALSFIAERLNQKYDLK